MYRGSSVRLTVDFPLKNKTRKDSEARRQWEHIFEVMKGREKPANKEFYVW